MFYNSQQGVALYLSLIVMTIILAIVFGLSVILVTQLKMTKEMSYSVKAFYAADTGIEKALNLDIADFANINEPNIFGTDYGYIVEITCCNPIIHPTCKIEEGIDCPVGLSTDDNCLGQYFCYKSKGIYKDITRAIETEQ